METEEINRISLRMKEICDQEKLFLEMLEEEAKIGPVFVKDFEHVTSSAFFYAEGPSFEIRAEREKIRHAANLNGLYRYLSCLARTSRQKEILDHEWKKYLEKYILYHKRDLAARSRDHRIVATRLFLRIESREYVSRIVKKIISGRVSRQKL